MYPENLPERGTAYLYFYGVYLINKLVQPLMVGCTLNDYPSGNRHSWTETYPQFKLTDVKKLSKKGFEVKMSFVPMDLCGNKLQGDHLGEYVRLAVQLGYSEEKAKKTATSNAAKAIENLFLACNNYPCNKVLNGGYWMKELVSTLCQIVDHLNYLRKENGANCGLHGILLWVWPHLCTLMGPL